jgi:hypothetical protein
MGRQESGNENQYRKYDQIRQTDYHIKLFATRNIESCLKNFTDRAIFWHGSALFLCPKIISMKKIQKVNDAYTCLDNPDYAVLANTKISTLIIMT